MGDFSNFIEELSDELSFYQCAKPSQKPKVTVIIPAYNVEDYISDCLLSVITQTLKDIEIIVMNDGSTDFTLSIIKTFMDYDARIKLINEENRGVGIVRNDALKHARGECILFVDSDDIIEPNLLETTYNIYNQEKTDVVIFGAYNLINNQHKKSSYSISKLPAKYKNNILSKDIAQKILFKIPVLVVCKLYRKEFLTKNNIYFQEGCIGEDQIFFIKTMLIAEKLFITDKNFYGYRRNRSKSLTSNKEKDNNSVILNFYEIEKFLRTENFPMKLKSQILYTYFAKCVSWLGKCKKSFKKEYFKDLQNLCRHLEQNYPELDVKSLNIQDNDSYLILKIKLLVLTIRRMKKWKM